MKKNNLYLLILIVINLFFINGCMSRDPIENGIQPGFNALNPAAIIAVPVFIFPDPSQNSSIDGSILASNQIVPLIETKIISAFSGQSAINGYPFNSVRKELKKKNSKVLEVLETSLKNIAARFTSQDLRDRLLLTPKCNDRKNFLEFYSFCVAPDTKWVSALNLLSSQIMNADSALIIVINNLSYMVQEDKYENNLGVSVFLVDTNNGNLIWGNTRNQLVQSAKGEKFFKNWDELIDKIFTPDFWANFPGLVNKQQLNYLNNTLDKTKA